MPIPVPLPVPIHATNNAVAQQRLDHPRILVSPRNLIYTGVALLSTGLINAVIGGVLVSKYQNSETVGKDIGLSQLGVGSVFVTTGLAMLTFGAFRLLA
ncbi:MAG TPA: hypothetical protein VFV57_06825, partial [Limnobacter sp.]|nr:hypothetical protein [Limnobacter sp.]